LSMKERLFGQLVDDAHRKSLNPLERA